MLRPQNSVHKRKVEDTAWGSGEQANWKPRKVCNHWKTGSCSKGTNCTFAHSASQLHPEAAQEEFDVAAELEERAQLLGETVEEDDAPVQTKGGGKDKGAGKGGKGGTRFPVFFRPMRICQQILAGSCPKGDACSFAHCLKELHLNASEEEKAAALVLEETGELEAGGKSLADDLNLLEGVEGEGEGEGQGAPDEMEEAVAALEEAEKEAGITHEETQGGWKNSGSWGNNNYNNGGNAKKPFVFQPRKMCGFFVQNKCKKGDACTYAHSPDQLHPEAKQIAEEQGIEAVTAQVPNQGGWAASAAEEGAEDGQLPAETPKEDYGIVGSSLDGPREFPAGKEPTQVCMAWLRHSNHCEAADFCPLAHGLDELKTGIEVKSIKCTNGPAALVSGQAGADGAAGYKGRGPVAIAPWTGGKGKAAASWGKGKFDYNAAYQQDGGDEGKGSWGKGYSKGKGAKGESRFQGDFRPSKLCNFWMKDPNGCKAGNDCTFAHGVDELNPTAQASCDVDRFHNKHKPTKMCTFFQQNACTKGLACTFAHDESELAPQKWV